MYCFKIGGSFNLVVTINMLLEKNFIIIIFWFRYFKQDHFLLLLTTFLSWFETNIVLSPMQKQFCSVQSQMIMDNVLVSTFGLFYHFAFFSFHYIFLLCYYLCMIWPRLYNHNGTIKQISSLFLNFHNGITLTPNHEFPFWIANISKFFPKQKILCSVLGKNITAIYKVGSFGMFFNCGLLFVLWFNCFTVNG